MKKMMKLTATHIAVLRSSSPLMIQRNEWMVIIDENNGISQIKEKRTLSLRCII